MRSVGAVALLAVLAGCGEQAENEASAEPVATYAPYTTPDPEGMQQAPTPETVREITLPSGEVIHPEPEGPVVQPPPEGGDIPPCLSLPENARNVRVERTESRYGPRFVLAYAVDVPIPEAVAFVEQSVRQNGCRLDHTMTSRHGMEFFTLWSSRSARKGRSASITIGTYRQGESATGVSAEGHWIEP